MEDQEVQKPDDQVHPDPKLVTETDYSPPRGSPFPIVGIGASAGGLEAFAQLLGALPTNSGMAFVLVQHLDPQHESLLTEILGPSTRLPVEQVHDGVEVKPNHVYVIPPNAAMALNNGRLRLLTREPGLHLPIDIFFRSLAQVQGSRAIGVVLSGNASDGSLGVRAIKAECGITFAQDESTARFGGMPRNAVATGAIDYVLPPADIGKELGRLGRHRFLVPATPGVAESEILPDGDGDLRRVVSILQAVTKVDFSQYKPTTIQRRIGRRMMILHIETLAEYGRYLQQNPAEVRELYRDVLISVTSFFRDAGTFEALAKSVAATLERREQADEAIRVWVPGCATGEEVYSLAITLHEMLQERQKKMPMQFFGTDISDVALDRARKGLYGSVIAADVSEDRLRRFFTKVDSGYQINKMIREMCVFARHDVIKDPPFSHLDLVSCRNVLIYLDAKAQRRVLPTFHYALKQTGMLVLGSAETTGAASDLFTTVDKAHHIFAPKAVASRLTLDFTPSSPVGEVVPVGRITVPGDADIQRKLERLIQSKYSPDAIFVNADMQILQFRGHTAAYLDPSPGEASLNLLRMARESLVLPLRRAIQKAIESGITVRENGIDLPGEEGGAVSIEVTPILGGAPSERFFFVVFSRSSQTDKEHIERRVGNDGGEPGSALGRELADTRDYLRHVTEEYEAYAEELRAANEEARSANEELQSTNEELGTTKEELQSANEELVTVNEELRSRNQELAATNSDLRNILSAVTVAIIMVDQELRIRRVNSAAEKLLDLRPIDIGRPLGHIRGTINASRLEKQAQEVIETLYAVAEDIEDSEGHWFSVNVRPYRTADDHIAGAVVTLQDINPLKRALEAAEEARESAEAMIDTVREPLLVLDGDLRVQKATAAFYSTFMVSREETEGRFLYDLGNGQWNITALRERLGAALYGSEAFHDFEVDHDFPHIGRRSMRLNARRIPRRDDRQRELLLAIEDVTERREIAEIRYQRLFETAKDGIVLIDAETETVQDVNPHFLQMTALPREDWVGKPAVQAGRLVGMSEIEEVITATHRSEIVRREEITLTSRDGKTRMVDVIANRYLVGTQPVVQLNVRDVSARTLAAQALAETEERFRRFVDSVKDYAMFYMDVEGKILTWNSGAERLLGWAEEEVLGRAGALIFTPEDIARGEPEKELHNARTRSRAEDERWHIRKDGSRFFASGVMTCVNNTNGDLLGFAKVMRDVTERMHQEEELRRSLEEKSTLVREIHHRVKNNLQVIVSLLSLQASHAQEPQIVAAFSETESRVRAIARIHEQLYASVDLKEVEVAEYLTSLARELEMLHATVPGGIALHIETQSMVLDIEQAIPLGLIANELILNSLKHGLKSGTGNLTVSLSYIDYRNEAERIPGEPQGVSLRVQDDGPGLPQGLDITQTNSMGFQLIQLLVRQLGAHLEILEGPGAGFAVSFPLK